MFFVLLCLGLSCSAEVNIDQQEATRAILSLNALMQLKKPVFYKTQKKLPADASFVFIDLKCFIPGDYDRQASCLKVCEFGNAIYAGRPDSPQIINGQKEKIKSPYWEYLWPYLKTFDLPVWCIGARSRVAYGAMMRSRAHWLPSLQELEDSTRFRHYVYKKNKRASNKNTLLPGYDGIIIFTGQRSSLRYQEFKIKYPQFLYLNDQIEPYLSQKDLINQVFDAPGLQRYKPAWKTYEKGCSRELIDQIKHDFAGCEHIMIKPIKSMQSRGVTMIRLDQLDQRLQLIFGNKRLLEDKNHRAFQHWLEDKNSHFIIEEYAPSKKIQIEGKPYDPTMRVVVLAHHAHGIITVHVIGGFWKIPLLSLEDEGSLTEKHVTIPFTGSQFVGIPIQVHDMEVVKDMVGEMFCGAYERMLELSSKK